MSVIILVGGSISDMIKTALSCHLCWGSDVKLWHSSVCRDLAWTGELMRANILHVMTGAMPHGEMLSDWIRKADIACLSMYK